MTGWGQDGPVRAAPPGTTSTTSRWPAPSPTSAATARRRCRRSTWSATSAAAACSWPSAWSARCSRRSAAVSGQVVDAAMVDGAAVLMSMFWAFKAHRPVRRERSGHQPARHRRALLRRVPVRRRQVHLDRLDRAAVLRRAAAAHRARRRPRVRPADGQGDVAAPQGAPRRAVRSEDPRRVVRADGAHRRLLRSGADDERGGAASAQRRARHVRRDRAATPQPAPAPRFSRTRRRGHQATRPSGPALRRDPRATGASTPPQSRR